MIKEIRGRMIFRVGILLSYCWGFLVRICVDLFRITFYVIFTFYVIYVMLFF